ncbi:MAG: DUF167 domain-containing protein [Acidobacteriota bacterium]
MITALDDGVTLDVSVVPRAGRTHVAGTRSGALLIRLAAAPVAGAANTELLRFLALTLDVPASHVSLLQGATNQSKRVKVVGVDAHAVRARLARLIDGR